MKDILLIIKLMTKKAKKKLFNLIRKPFKKEKIKKEYESMNMDERCGRSLTKEEKEKAERRYEEHLKKVSESAKNLHSSYYHEDLDIEEYCQEIHEAKQKKKKRKL